MLRKPLAISAVLTAPMLLVGQAQADSTYIALGDSITFGETDLRYIQSDGDQGYVSRFADYLGQVDGQRPNVLNFAIDGETTDSFVDGDGRVPPVVGRTDVPLALQNTSYDEGNLIPQQQQFRNAVQDQRSIGNTIDNITITLGFNDLADLASTDNPVEQIDERLATYESNYTDLLSDIRSEAPDADLYLLGYYNPFPADPGNPAEELFAEGGPQLNQIIEGLAEEFDAFYVDTATPYVGQEAELTFLDEFPAGSTVPEPTPFGPGTAPIGNVHPNAEGYQVIADQIAAIPSPTALTAGLLGLGLTMLRRRRSAQTA